MTTFADLGLSDAVLAALRDVGYESPSPIQEQAIPDLLAGRDVIGQAQTGTGKTAAFGLPMIDFVDQEDPETQALVLTPTRELCIQVTQALRTYGRHRGIDPVAVFGGAPIRTQQAQLKAGAQVVVGTVGRVTALFSATMPAEIRALAERHLYDPVTVKVKSATLTIDTVEQFFVETKAADKNETLVKVLEAERPDQAIVFVRTKIRCDQLYRTLRDRGMNVKALHGDMSQGARDGVMISFKDERVKILVATDVAARGLDISTVTHIINFDVPTSPDVYVHRIGRTGRVGRSGRAITFVEPRQARDLAAIEKHANTHIAPWAEGAHVAPAKVQETRPRRHRKPHDDVAAVNGDGAFRKLIASGGRAAGLAEADLIAAVTATGLDGEAVRNVRLLERFALLEVPAADAERVADTVDGTEVRGHTLRLELAKA